MEKEILELKGENNSWVQKEVILFNFSNSADFSMFGTLHNYLSFFKISSLCWKIVVLFTSTFHFLISCMLRFKTSFMQAGFEPKFNQMMDEASLLNLKLVKLSLG